MGKHSGKKESAGAKSYVKFFVALAGFIATVLTLVTTYAATGAVDIDGFVAAGITFLTAIGVYQLPNKKVEK